MIYNILLHILIGDFLLIAGIDEAGRGAVIGPLVLCGACFEEDKAAYLKKIGVRDSKDLSPKRREVLAKAIEKTAKDIIVIKVSPCVIDNRKAEGLNLNQLEAVKMADIVNYLKPDKTYIDSPDVNTERLKKFIAKMLKEESELVVEHKADQNYPEVGAASIIAKVERDAEIMKLGQKYGKMGSGYPSDERTTKWLNDWIHDNKNFPDIVRRSWVTISILEKQKQQTKLSGWLKKNKK